MRHQIPKISSGNLVVLLIDMQDHFIGGDEEKKGLIANQKSVLRFCQEKDVPVVVIEYEGEGSTTSSLLEELGKIASCNCHKVVKGKDDAFDGTRLDTLLSQLHAKVLLLMGINACKCVRDTALSAIRRGYTVITSETLIAGYCPSCRRKGIARWYTENVPCPKDYNHILERVV